MGAQHGSLVAIDVADDPVAWASLGFTVPDDGRARIGRVEVRLTGADDGRGRGIVAWTLATPATAGDVDGLPTSYAVAPGDRPAAAVHANGVTVIDHLVVATPDIDRTTEALGAVGLEARRTREAGAGRLQRFFRLGEVVLEVVGPARPAGTGPAAFWGLALTVDDIDATAVHLGDRIGTPKTAVQAGRRIATLRPGPDVSVPLAVMSPPPTPGGGSGAGR